MSYTRFGEFVRVLRVKSHEVMGDMARLLNTSTPFLSAVENGKKNVPKEWPAILIKHYRLSEEEQKDLYNAIEESRTQMKINMQSAGSAQRQVAVQFARSFNGMDEETANKIMKLLEESGKNGLPYETDE